MPHDYRTLGQCVKCTPGVPELIDITKSKVLVVDSPSTDSSRASACSTAGMTHVKVDTYYCWAPLSRVYGYYYSNPDGHLPQDAESSSRVSSKGSVLSTIWFWTLQHSIRMHSFSFVNLTEVVSHGRHPATLLAHPRRDLLLYSNIRLVGLALSFHWGR